MYRSGRLACHTITCREVAGRALRRYNDVAVKLTWTPARITTLVAGVAVCDRHTSQALVWDVVRGLAVGRWVTSCVTGRALVRHCHLGVVPTTGLPGCCCGTVAADAVRYCRNMRCVFTCRGLSVMSGATCRRSRIRTVIGLRSQPAGRIPVAALTIASH